MTTIHPTALVEEGAQLGEGCVIGPFCCVGPEVVLGDRVELKSHVVVKGDTTIGDDSVIFSFAVVGEIPQDKKFGGEHSKLIIGARNRIREHVTMNTGTEGGGGITRVGDDGLFMAGCHIAHDAQIGDRVIVVNQTAIAGHVILEDDVIVGGLSGVHQFVRVGRGAMVGAMSKVVHDVIPYGMIGTNNGTLDGLNLIGLKRRGMTRADISAVRAAFRKLSEKDGTFLERARALAEQDDNPHVQEITAFILGDSDRAFHTPGH